MAVPDPGTGENMEDVSDQLHDERGVDDDGVGRCFCIRWKMNGYARAKLHT